MQFPLSVYDSGSARCKTPYGAVPSGTRVRFALRPPRREGWSRGTLHAFFEALDRTVLLPMPWSGMEGERDVFSCALEAGDYVGLVWYSFTLERLDGEKLDSGRYQLTVYDGSEEVPGWFGEGMSYQIFPDRFFRQEVPDPTGMVGGRQVHRGWEEEPVWRPDEHGEVRNRDFFGGSLAGVTEKLDYLRSLGVETLYLNPIFEAAENHRYGTGDYEKIDPMLGTEEDFSRLCAQAHRRGMRVILDGVFNHVGFVSKYFNGDGSYPAVGAAQSPESPYASWFRFTRWPDEYESWWGIYSLPAVEEENGDYLDYMVRDENSIVRRWLRAGADGWRLDVADELPDSFIRALHQAVREEKPDGVVIGEVWEDGSNKIAYGVRRKHLLGRHCDGLMNYPLRTALLDYLRGGRARDFRAAMERLRENYPRSAFYTSMNSLGTHDTPRALTLLGADEADGAQSKEWKSCHRLTPEQRELGRRRLKLGFLLLFSFPGSPTVYYGDEAGLEGWEDPFNRRTFPWGREDGELQAWVAALGKLRRTSPALRRGELEYLTARGHVLALLRTDGEQTMLAAANAGRTACTVALPRGTWRVLLGDGTVVDRSDGSRLRLGPCGGAILEREDPTGRGA